MDSREGSYLTNASGGGNRKEVTMKKTSTKSKAGKKGGKSIKDLHPKKSVKGGAAKKTTSIPPDWF